MKENVSAKQRYFKNGFNYQMHIPQRVEAHISWYTYFSLIGIWEVRICIADLSHSSFSIWTVGQTQKCSSSKEKKVKIHSKPRKVNYF